MITITYTDGEMHVVSEENNKILMHTKLSEIATMLFMQMYEDLDEDELKIDKKEYMEGLCMTMLKILAKEGVINERKTND